MKHSQSKMLLLNTLIFQENKIEKGMLRMYVDLFQTNHFHGDYTLRKKKNSNSCT